MVGGLARFPSAPNGGSRTASPAKVERQAHSRRWLQKRTGANLLYKALSRPCPYHKTWVLASRMPKGMSIDNGGEQVKTGRVGSLGSR